MKKTIISLLGMLLSSQFLFAQTYERGTSWWLPKNNSPIGAEIDYLFDMIMWITCVGFILAFAVLIWFMIKYRAKEGGKAIYSHGNSTAEIIWTVSPTIILIVIFILSDSVWQKVRTTEASPDAEIIEVQAQQFQWNVRYPGPDGKFGAIDFRQVTTDNIMGIDSSDVNGKDDLVFINQMTIPVGKQIELRLTTKDVIQSLFLPEYRLKTDILPGNHHRMIFSALLPAQTEIACAELCGLGHYRMRGYLNAIPQDEYDKWKKDEYAKITAAASDSTIASL